MCKTFMYQKLNKFHFLFSSSDWRPVYFQKFTLKVDFEALTVRDERTEMLRFLLILGAFKKQTNLDC